jgi:hypothetical protein
MRHNKQLDTFELVRKCFDSKIDMPEMKVEKLDYQSTSVFLVNIFSEEIIFRISNDFGIYDITIGNTNQKSIDIDSINSTIKNIFRANKLKTILKD